MSTTSHTRSQPMRLLVSPDGMRGANVHTLDVPNPMYAGWEDCTDLNDEEFHNLVAGRQLAARAIEEAA
jgi:hypothetical protein